jgi:Eukaryotic aspartyl protease
LINSRHQSSACSYPSKLTRNVIFAHLDKILRWDASQTATVADGGQFTLGGRNTSLYDGEITFLPLLEQAWWTIPFQAIIVNSNTELRLSGTYANAIVDSGTTLVYGPDDVINAFYAAIPGSQTGESIDPSLQGQWVIREYKGHDYS